MTYPVGREFECPKGWHVLQPWGNGYALTDEHRTAVRANAS
jgi:hypothetical protein